MDKFGILHIGKTGGTAAKAVLRANNALGAGEFCALYKHKIGLRNIAADNMCENLIFFIREPVSRFISAFNSRLRKGLPRYKSDWKPAEELAFSRFKTPNELAEALSAPDAERRRHAQKAMAGIRHLRNAYEHYLGSVELLEQEKNRIFIIGATETFDSDFALIRKLLNVSPDVQLPTDEYGSHRTPEGYEKTISDEGRKNVQDYYQNDYEIYNWCVKKREELLALRAI